MLGRRAVASVESYAKSAQPFLISLHFNAPHWPWEGPADQAEAERILKSNLRHCDAGSQRTYAAMCRAMDAEAGRVLKVLAEWKLLEDTIVSFTSDNGGGRFS